MKKRLPDCQIGTGRRLCIRRRTSPAGKNSIQDGETQGAHLTPGEILVSGEVPVTGSKVGIAGHQRAAVVRISLGWEATQG